MSKYIALEDTVINKVSYSKDSEIPAGALLPNNIRQLVSRGVIRIDVSESLPTPQTAGNILVVDSEAKDWEEVTPASIGILAAGFKSGADSELIQELKDKQTELEAVDATLSSKIYDLLVRLDKAEVEALDAQSDIDRLKSAVAGSVDFAAFKAAIAAL